MRGAQGHDAKRAVAALHRAGGLAARVRYDAGVDVAGAWTARLRA